MNRLIVISFLTLTPAAIADVCKDHPHAPGEHAAPGDHVTLSETQQKNLELESAPVETAPLAPSVEIPAVLVLPPERHARITAPFEGRVIGLLAKLGDHVKKDQPLLRVAPLAVGSPPQELKSPIDGVVFDQAAVIGTTFKPENTLLQIGDYHELLARGLLYQSPELTRILPGQKVTLRVDVFPGETFEGVVQRVDPGHGEASPFFHIYALIPNPDHKLHPNYRAQLTIATDEPKSALTVPRRAVLGNLGRFFVFVEEEPGHYERREVVVGKQSGDRMEIIEGLLPCDRVVTVGNYQLQYVQPPAGAEAAEDEHGHAH